MNKNSSFLLSTLSITWWPLVFFISISAARIYKFRLPLNEASAFLLQDLGAASVLFVLLSMVRSRCKTPGTKTLVSFLFFLPVFLISLLGLIPTGLLGIPVDGKLFFQLPSLIFVRSALGESAVQTSVAKMLLVAIIVPLVALVVSYGIERLVQAHPKPHAAKWLLAFLFIVGISTSAVRTDARARDTNALLTITTSALTLLTESKEKPPGISPQEYQTKVAILQNETSTSPEPNLSRLRFDGTQYDVVIYVLETGVAGIFNLEQPDEKWLKNLRRISADSLQLRRHLTPGPNSTKGIFGLVASRYPFPNYLSFIRAWPTAAFDTFFSILVGEGYRTVAFASIDGDYDRMDVFLANHGLLEQEDKNSLNLQLLSDATFGRDEEMLGHFFTWIESNPAKPYLSLLLPSNSHWPFFYEKQDALFAGDNRTAHYKNSLQYQDRIIGKFYDKLSAVGRLDRTIIIFVPDHGGYFNLTGGYENDASNLSQFHVPAFIDHPRLRGRASETIINVATSHVDIGPTVLDMCSNAKASEDMQGISLLNPLPKQRLVFFSEDFEDGLVSATDGNFITQWNRKADSMQSYLWVANSATKSVYQQRYEVEMRERIRVFYSYQMWLLKSLAHE